MAECWQPTDKKLYVKCLKSRTIGCTRAEKAAQFRAERTCWAPMFQDSSLEIGAPSSELRAGGLPCKVGQQLAEGALIAH